MALRQIFRPSTFTSRSILRVQKATFSVSSVVRGNHPHLESDIAPIGSGGKKGGVATDEEQAVGMERFEHIGRLQDKDVFNLNPIEIEAYGTLENPVVVQSADSMRIVGCSGFPVDSHVLNWIHVHENETARCGECGQAFSLKKRVKV